jgi:hypothetical protein
MHTRYSTVCVCVCVCVWSRYALLMHRGSAAAAKDTAGAAKARRQLCSKWITIITIWMQACSVWSMHTCTLGGAERRSRQRPAWNMVVCAHLAHMGCVNFYVHFHDNRPSLTATAFAMCSLIDIAVRIVCERQKFEKLHACRFFFFLIWKSATILIVNS